MTQWTAVEWLFERLATRMGDTIEEYKSTFELAREMEKEQIMNAYKADLYPCSDEDAEQYYNETFNK